MANVNVNEQDKKLIAESLTNLVKFGSNPVDKKAWDDARIALGQLGDIAGRLLADKPQEDVALSSSLSELDEFIDGLRHSPKNNDAVREFQVSLGDVEYRMKRLFGVTVR
jgi:hypothetical protein